MSDHAAQPNAPAVPPNAGDAHAPNAGHTAAHEHAAHGHAAPTAIPEAENMALGRVAAVGIVSLLVFAVGSVWALRMRSSIIDAVNPTHAANIPASLGAEEQGMVDQIPFDLNHWVKDDRATSAKQLGSYGWVDRKAGTIHIPIERAMELQLSEPKK